MSRLREAIRCLKRLSRRQVAHALLTWSVASKAIADQSERVLHAARCVAAQFMRHALCGTSQAFHAWRIHLDAHKKIAALSTTARTRALMAAFVHWTTHVDIERELERFLEMPRRCHVHRGLGGR